MTNVMFFSINSKKCGFVLRTSSLRSPQYVLINIQIYTILGSLGAKICTIYGQQFDAYGHSPSSDAT